MMISYPHVRYRDSTDGTDRLRSRTAEDRSNNGRNSQPVGIALKRCVGPGKGDVRSETQTQDECGWSCPHCRSPTKAMGCGEEAVRTCGPRRSSQAQAKTEQGWQGRNRRSLEEKVGGETDGGEGPAVTSQESSQESAGEG